MRKKAKYILASLLMFCFTTSVKAEECSYDKQVELNNVAATVKATYEEVEIDTGMQTEYVDPETGRIDINRKVSITENGFKVSLINITNELYVEVYKNGEQVREIHYEDTNNGTIEIGRDFADEVINYEFKIFAYTSDCGGTELRTLPIMIPRYNDYSESQFCADYPDVEFCSKYTTNNEQMTNEEFLSRTKTYLAKQKNTNETEKSELKKFYEKNKKIIIISASILIIVGVATTAIIVIRRRSRLI